MAWTRALRSKSTAEIAQGSIRSCVLFTTPCFEGRAVSRNCDGRNSTEKDNGRNSYCSRGRVLSVSARLLHLWQGHQLCRTACGCAPHACCWFAFLHGVQFLDVRWYRVLPEPLETRHISTHDGGVRTTAHVRVHSSLCPRAGGSMQNNESQVCLVKGWWSSLVCSYEHLCANIGNWELNFIRTICFPPRTFQLFSSSHMHKEETSCHWYICRKRAISRIISRAFAAS